MPRAFGGLPAHRLTSLVMALLTVAVGGCSVGNVELGDNTTRRGDITLKVGNVVVGRECSVAGDVRLTAGNVEVGRDSEISGAVSVTHGNVTLDAGVQARSVKVANGTIELGERVAVADFVRLTNGLIDLRGAEVGGLVELTRGRLEVGPGSILRGGLRVENTGHTVHDSTYVIIRAGAEVAGTVAVRGLARLIVEPGARVQEAAFEGIAPAESW